MSIAITYFIVYVTEALIAYYYLRKIFSKKISNFVLLLGYTISYGIQYMISFTRIANINLIVFIITNFLLIFLLYKTSTFIAFLHSMVMSIMMGFGEIITNALLNSPIYQYEIPDLKQSVFIIYFIISKTLYYILMLIIAHLFSKKKEQPLFYDKTTLVLLTVPILSLFLMTTFYNICSTMLILKRTENLIIISSFCIMLINILIVCLFEYLQDKQSKIAQLELEVQREADSKQYSKLLEQQDISQKILVHDIKHHLQNIQQLQHAKEYEQAEQYIENILNEPSLRHSFKPTKNKLLNLILSQYILSCEKKHISLKIDAQNTDIDFLSDADITALFCNLLDNAIEASENIEEAIIECKITDKEDTAITVISLVNSCRIAPKKATNRFFLSSKEEPERHGIGMRSINRIVEKYSGIMENYYNENRKEFHTTIALTNKQPAVSKINLRK